MNTRIQRTARVIRRTRSVPAAVATGSTEVIVGRMDSRSMIAMAVSGYSKKARVRCFAYFPPRLSASRSAVAQRIR